MNRPPVAALLSFLIPGVGQIYNREYFRGLFWLIVTPGLWIGSAGLLGWVLHIVSAATAYHRAELHHKRSAWPMRLEA
jgi:TM2 domain-containing membrane protein YozV